MRGLAEKVIVVAGGASGLGAGIVRRLTDEGSRVVIGDIDTERAHAMQEELRSNGHDVLAVGFDMADEDSVRALYDAGQREYGTVDGTAVCAAELRPEYFDMDRDAVDLPDRVLERIMRVNLNGSVYCTRYVMPYLSNGGSIVYLSSMSVHMGEASLPAYAMSKSAVEALARHVATRWGPQGVTANAVAPGLAVTGHPREATPRHAEARRNWLQRSAIPRLGSAADIAALTTFLLSPEAGWITGQSIGINGGYLYR